MGLYDREYYRDEQPTGLHLTAPRSMLITLIIVNAAAYFANMLLTELGYGDNVMTHYMAVTPNTLVEPWMWWQFITNGFAHSSLDFRHILFNMFGLWVFGTDVERRYGRWEFLRIYLVVVVLGSVLWAARMYFFVAPPWGGLIGASGAVFAIGTLFICNFPNRQMLLMFVIPVKAWVVGIIYMVALFFGLQSMASGGDGTAHDVHLVGLLFGAAYFYFHWNLGWMMPAGLLHRLGQTWKRVRPGAPNLRVHTPDPENQYQKMDEEADRLLDKVHREGEASLTARERRLLEDYSRRMKQKHR
ncbi:MAG: rhomboid family intramembrane serine protease [Pirellulaceae bacterium]